MTNGDTGTEEEGAKELRQQERLNGETERSRRTKEKATSSILSILISDDSGCGTKKKGTDERRKRRKSLYPLAALFST